MGLDATTEKGQAMSKQAAQTTAEYDFEIDFEEPEVTELDEIWEVDYSDAINAWSE